MGDICTFVTAVEEKRGSVAFKISNSLFQEKILIHPLLLTKQHKRPAAAISQSFTLRLVA